MSRIFLSRLHFPISTLGPGQRIGIWFQGCGIGCKGCISRDTWNRDPQTQTSVAEVTKALRPWLGSADGITISGGEPFEQSEALIEILRWTKSNWQGDVLVYSGLELEDIRDTVSATRGMIDALITGPYRESTPQTLPLRGSDNQTLHLLTALGRERFRRHLHSQGKTPSKVVDLMQDQRGALWMAGIPSREDWKQLSEILIENGNVATTSSEPNTAGRNHHS